MLNCVRVTMVPAVVNGVATDEGVPWPKVSVSYKLLLTCCAYIIIVVVYTGDAAEQ